MNTVQKTLLLLLLFSQTVFSSSSFFDEEGKKATQNEQKESAPYALYRKLFIAPYKLKPTSTPPCTYESITEAIGIIKKAYEHKWKQNNLANNVKLKKEEHFSAENTSFIKTTLIGDLLQPVLEKVVLKKGNTLYIHGDLHGDVLSLLSIIAQLQKEKKMDASFVLKKGTKIILLGDYTDRGLYSVQTIKVIAKLIQANPENVLLLRGNHETKNIEFAEDLCRTFVKDNQTQAPQDALLTQRFWLQTASYFPHVLFLEIKPKKPQSNIPVIACMHAAPPSFIRTEETSKEDLNALKEHCTQVQNFLLGTNTMTTAPLNLSECFNRNPQCKDTYFPPYLWNYILGLEDEDQKHTIFYDGSPVLGDTDIGLWMENCSTRRHQIFHMAKGHQQVERNRFDGTIQNTYGVCFQFDNKLSVHNIAPRCVFPGIVNGYWENRADTWSKIKITDKNPIFSTLYFDFFTGEPTSVPEILAQKEQILVLSPEIATTQKIVTARPLFKKKTK